MIAWNAYPAALAELRIDPSTGDYYPDELARPGRVARLAFDPTGQFLVTMPKYDDLIRPPCVPATVWRPDGTRVHDLPPVLPTTDPTAVAVGPGAAWVAVGTNEYDRGDQRGVLRWWNPAAGRASAERGAAGRVEDIRLLPGGGLLVASGSAWTHAARLGAAPVRLPSPINRYWQVVRVAASSERLAGASKNRALVWDADGGPVASREHKPSPQNGPVAFRPASTVLAVGHGTVVDLWDFQSGDVLTLAGHKRPVWAVGFSPDGGTAYTAASDGAVIAWDADTGAVRQRFDFGTGKLYSAAVAPDGLTMALGGDDGRVTVVDVDA